MLSEVEILERCQKFSKMAQEAENKRPFNAFAKLFNERYSEYREEIIPEYYPGYRAAVEDFEAIRVHADKSVFPARLFAKRAPNQTDKAAEWIRENYKNITQPVFLDFENTVTLCTKDNLWSIEYGEESNEITASQMTFEQYVEKDLKDYRSVENFFKSILFDIKLKDAMGIIAVKPHQISTTTNNEGETVVSSIELPEPVPVYYTCRQVVDFKGGEYAYVELYEKSFVYYQGGQPKKMGRIYEVYDDQNIYRVTQIGKYIENQFQIEVYYNHAWDRLPAERLKGVPRIMEDRVFYQSQFLFAVDLLDIVAQNHSYLQASIAKCVFPATVALGNICDFEDSNHNRCNDGIVSYFEDREGETINRNYTCPKCNGAGLISRIGALETLLLKPYIRGVNEESEAASGQKPLQYISPEVTTLEFLENNISLREEKARKILHLQTSNSEVKGAENMTATGMMIDREAKESFIMPIAYQGFELLEFIYNAIGWMRYRERFVTPKINYPQGVELGSAQDILYTISEMTKNNVPEILIHAEVYRYLKAIYYTEKRSSEVYRLINEADRVMIMSSDDIAIRSAKGQILDWELVLHDSAINFINELILEDEEFFKKDLQVQKQKLTDKAKVKAQEIKTTKEIQLPGVETLIREDV